MATTCRIHGNEFHDGGFCPGCANDHERVTCAKAIYEQLRGQGLTEGTAQAVTSALRTAIENSDELGAYQVLSVLVSPDLIVRYIAAVAEELANDC